MNKYFLWEVSMCEFHWHTKRTPSIYLSDITYRHVESVLDARCLDLPIHRKIYFQYKHIAQSDTLKHTNNNSDRSQWKNPNEFTEFRGTKLDFIQEETNKEDYW